MRALGITGFIIIIMTFQSWSRPDTIKIGVIGLTHTHVHWIFDSEEKGDFTIAGIVESNKELAKRYADQYNFPMSKVYHTMEDLIAASDLDAVCAFGTIYDHLSVVETFAPLGIHVMVEKPLAVSIDHARKMEALAKKHNIHLLTNYETTWYPTNHKACDLVKNDNAIGEIRKIIVRDGHRGPKNIGVDPEFLEWLTDPLKNGGGAIIDFGCYGANLLTWLMDGEKPVSVTAVTQQLQKENNPLVDDEANIILQYPSATAIIQASWNWPIGRKDMEIYGLTGAIFADNRHDLRIRIAEGYDGYKETELYLGERPSPFDDPFSFFAAVIHKEIKMSTPYNLSSLENNMIVMEILDAAVRSALTGKTIYLENK